MDLIDHLSPQASVWRVIDPDVVWTPDLMLLAALVDEIRVLRWEFEKVNFKGKSKRPEPIPRPGVQPSVERDVVGAGDGFETIADFDAWYAQVQAVQRPEITEAGQILPRRDASGRFVSARA